jgi:gliding motility-associated-like protein
VIAFNWHNLTFAPKIDSYILRGSQFAITTLLMLCIGFWSAPISAQALDAPVPTCVQVTGTGQVVVLWEVPADPLSEFVSYELFSSVAAGPFTSIATIPNSAVTTYLDVLVDANIDTVCYYLVTNSNDGAPQTSADSDTICVPKLTLATVPLGFAQLAWGDPYQFSSPPNSTEYEVWLNYPAGNWQLLDVLPWGTNTYSYEVNICSAVLEFQIRVNTPFGCQSISNSVSDAFIDATSPDPPEISYVTVNPLSNKAIVNWTPSSASDTWGYIIYQVFNCASSFNTPLDTIYGADIDTWEWPQSQAGIIDEETFVIAAFDSCMTGLFFDNLSPTSGDCHTTIFLANDAPSQCEDFSILSWTEYIGWPDGVDYYEVHASIDGGADQLIATLDGTTLTYTHEGLNFSSQYAYYIQAYAIDGITSESNVRVFVPFQFSSPTFCYLLSATVIDRYEVAIGVLTETTTVTSSYVLEKLDDFDNQFHALETISDNANTILFNDFAVDTRYESYQYRVLMINDCGDTVLTSNLGKTILLDGLENNTRLTNTLTWTEYLDWDGGVDTYNIYRSETPGDLGTQVATFGSGSVTNFEDDVTDLLLTPGEFCYTIEALNDPSSFGGSAFSWSNQVCLQMEPKIWIPNAFMVNGFNNIFTPVIGYADFDSYSMNIYSRWGDLVFSTNDITVGWDGRTGNKYVPEGLYAYLVTIRDGEGITHNRKGTVTMLFGSED